MRGARREHASLRPDLPGIRAAARAAVALVIRTLTLRAALLVTTYAVTIGATGHDERVGLATHQIAITLWTFLAFVLDAIAIAAQAITGRYLGAGDVTGTREVTRRMVQWGAIGGVVCGVLLVAASPFLGVLFTPDPAVRELLVPVLVVAALGQPIAGVVFVLDGVLIGAGDGAYLAWAGLVVLVVYAPLVLVAAPLTGGLVAVWVVFSTVFLGARLVVLARRALGDAWLVTGPFRGQRRDARPGEHPRRRLAVRPVRSSSSASALALDLGPSPTLHSASVARSAARPAGAAPGTASPSPTPAPALRAQTPRGPRPADPAAPRCPGCARPRRTVSRGRRAPARYGGRGVLAEPRHDDAGGRLPYRRASTVLIRFGLKPASGRGPSSSRVVIVGPARGGRPRRAPASPDTVRAGPTRPGRARPAGSRP